MLLYCTANKTLTSEVQKGSTVFNLMQIKVHTGQSCEMPLKHILGECYKRNKRWGIIAHTEWTFKSRTFEKNKETSTSEQIDST